MGVAHQISKLLEHVRRESNKEADRLCNRPLPESMRAAPLAG